MGRKIAGTMVGALILIVIGLLTGGLLTAVYHLERLDRADVEHQHAALAAGGVVMIAIGAMLGGALGTYAGVWIARWRHAAWIIALIGALDAYSASGMFANEGELLAASLIATVLGCWTGAQLARRQVGV